MARFKLFGRRDPDDSGISEVAYPPDDVQSIGTKYTTLSGDGGAARFGPGEPPQGREGFVEVIASTHESQAAPGEPPDARFWQGLVENQDVRAAAPLDTWEHAATAPDEGPSTMVAADPDNGDASLVFQKIQPELLQTETMFDSVTPEDDWEAPDV